MENKPVVTMTMEERDHLREQAGSLLETAKRYWPMIVLLAGASGLTGKEVAQQTAKPVEAKVEIVKPAEVRPVDDTKTRLDKLEGQFKRVLDMLEKKKVSVEVTVQEEDLDSRLDRIINGDGDHEARIRGLEDSFAQLAGEATKTRRDAQSRMDDLAAAVGRLSQRVDSLVVQPQAKAPSWEQPQESSSVGAGAGSCSVRSGLFGRRGGSCR